MALDKYSRLKIAGNVLDESVTSMAASWDVTLQTVKGVCDGTITSARIEKNINEKIAEAERIYDEHRKKNRLTLYPPKIMNETAQITRTKIHWLKIGEIEVNHWNGTQSKLRYPVVRGVMLVPLSDGRKLGLSPSTLRHKIKSGQLTAYNQDGSLRAANARTDIYFDPADFFTK